MTSRLIRFIAMSACAASLSACMLGATPDETRTIRYAYCTDTSGNVVNDPAAAVQKGLALRCYNFVSK